MTTESLMTKPGSASRIAPSVLTGIAAFSLVGVYVLASSVGLGLWTSLGPGAGLFPFAMGALLVAMSAVWLVQELRRPSAKSEGVDKGVVVSVVVSLVVLASVMDLLGFQLSMFLFLLYHLKIRGRRTWISSLVIALLGSVGAFYAFTNGLNVALPVSSLAPLSVIGL